MRSDESKVQNPIILSTKDSNIFGLHYSEQRSKLVLLPVPWDVTTSYLAGTRDGPEAIFTASKQVDRYFYDAPQFWQQGIHMRKVPELWHTKATSMREKAVAHIRYLEETGEAPPSLSNEGLRLNEINAVSEDLFKWLQEEVSVLLERNKLVGVVGGEHGISLAPLKALSEKYKDFSILQIDAHADLRNAYEGFTHSHASVMFNALKFPQITKLVQVGIRDYCAEEFAIINDGTKRVCTYFDAGLKDRLLSGDSWASLVEKIVANLGERVYVSFDIDGLDPKLCPSTGTPVPGGLSFDQAMFLLKAVWLSGRTIIGFDLVEVVPGPREWDQNVGARVLFHLCGYTLSSPKS